MKKTLLISLALVMAFVITSVATEKPGISGTTLGDNDTLIYLSGQTSGQPVMLHREQNSITMSPYEPQSPLWEHDGIMLDVPGNDNCADAIATNEVDSLPFTLVDATIDGGNLSTYPNVWFLYTATITDKVRIFTTNAEGENRYADIAIYEGTTCPEYVEIPDPVELLGGETIETAVAINDPLPIALQGTFDDYALDYMDCSCMISLEYRGPDVVYSYTATADDLINFVLRSSTSTVALIIMDEYGNELSCGRWVNYQNSDEGASGTVLYNFLVEEGETYYLVISAYSGSTGDDSNYTLTIYSPNEITLDRSINGWGAHADVIFDVVAGNQYLIEAFSSSEYAYTLTVEQIATPDNDECENATDGGILAPNTVLEFNGNNTGATMDCGMLSRFGDVWIKFTTEDTLDVKLDFCGSAAPETGEGYSCVAITFTDDYCPCISDGWVNGVLDESSYFYYCPEHSFITYWYDLPPNTYYYPLISNYWWETDYVINITGIEKQYCNSDAIFGQGPDIDQESYMFYSSGFESAYACFDKIEDVENPINEISWWGEYFNSETTEGCDPTEYSSFQIVFCNINEDYSYKPGDTLGVYEVEATSEETGHMFFYGQQKKFTAILPEDIEFDEGDGWIMIRDHGDNSDDCYFAWQTSSISGDAIQYNELENSWTRYSESMAFCLSHSPVDVDEEPVELPITFELLQNYPNPFNATTSIMFSLKESGDVSLTVYDVGGRLIKTLHNGELNAGYHTVIWDGTNQSGETVSSGIYFYKLDTSEGTFNNRMVLLK